MGVMRFRLFKPEAWEEISRWWMTRSGRNHRRAAVINRALEGREKSSNQLTPLQGARWHLGSPVVMLVPRFTTG